MRGCALAPANPFLILIFMSHFSVHIRISAGRNGFRVIGLFPEREQEIIILWTQALPPDWSRAQAALCEREAGQKASLLLMWAAR